MTARGSRVTRPGREVTARGRPGDKAMGFRLAGRGHSPAPPHKPKFSLDKTREVMPHAHRYPRAALQAMTPRKVVVSPPNSVLDKTSPVVVSQGMLTYQWRGPATGYIAPQTSGNPTDPYVPPRGGIPSPGCPPSGSAPSGGGPPCGRG